MKFLSKTDSATYLFKLCVTKIVNAYFLLTASEQFEAFNLDVPSSRLLSSGSKTWATSAGHNWQLFQM